MERNHAACGDGNGLAGLGVAARARRFVAHLEIAKTRELDGISARKSVADFLEEGIDNVLGFALVQADPLKEQFGKLSLGQGAWLGSKHTVPHGSCTLARAVGTDQCILDAGQAIRHTSFVQGDLSVL
ncbi:hypothetical protein D3C71_1678770 [compost metagenome]